MTPLFRLALESLWSRRATAGLTILAIALSMALLLGVEKVRRDAKQSFADTVSGVDLIVGARTGPTQLLLYSVFRIGDATNNISWASYRRFRDRPEVAWTIPLSLGDSHRGYRVLGTSAAYFEHLRYGPKRKLAFAAGGPFVDLFDVALGAEVADALGYRLGDRVVIAHGLGAEGFTKHGDKPFRVAGVLERTGTPVDRTVHVSLAGIEAVHVDWKGGSRVPGARISADDVRAMDLTPRSITAFMVGLKSRLAVFRLQRAVNEHRREPLTGILPGVALQSLWDLMGVAETALAAISVAVVGAGLLGMTIMLLAGLGERRREMAILRAVGARPAHIFGLLVLEAAALTAAGALVGAVFLYAGVAVAQPYVEATFGLYLPVAPPSARDWTLIGLAFLAGVLAGAVPAWRACRQSLADGMTVKG